ncbi:MAG: hypothetical protein ACOX2O_07595 [Bdellovibrionota bacterium]
MDAVKSSEEKGAWYFVNEPRIGEEKEPLYFVNALRIGEEKGSCVM